MKKKIPAGKAGKGLRALKSKAPEVAKRMVTQVLNAKLLRLVQTVRTAAIIGVDARITSVLATRV